METKAYEGFRKKLFEAIWRDLDPLEHEIEETERLPYDKLFPLLREMRAFGLLIPEEYGGLGLTVSQYLPILAEFAKIQGGIRVVVHVHNSMAHALSELGSDRQCKEVLPGAAEGREYAPFGLFDALEGGDARGDSGARTQVRDHRGCQRRHSGGGHARLPRVAGVRCAEAP